jgi:ElaB/YqjD/DUF883 family membrane-anchored ribosome-binding protein
VAEKQVANLEKINMDQTKYALKSDIEEIKSILTDYINTTAKHGKSNLHDKTEDLRNIAYQAGETIRDRYQSGKNAVQNGITESQVKVEDAIRQRPITSAAIAFGVGVMFASLLNSCSKR